ITIIYGTKNENDNYDVNYEIILDLNSIPRLGGNNASNERQNVADDEELNEE
ncbi:hypothetical protein KI387_023799, partial [Taxus chinensis]